MTPHFSMFFYGLAWGSLLVATYYGERFSLPARPYFGTLATLIAIGYGFQAFGM